MAREEAEGAAVSVIFDMPEVEYHRHPALSSTGARRLLRPSCPALFDWERKHPRPPTKAMRLGRAAREHERQRE